MAITNINAAGAASANVKSDPSRDASSTSRSVAPVFSRAAPDEGKLPGLRSLDVAEGRLVSDEEVERALTGDLLRIVRDLRAGDLPKANAKLHEMKGTLPDNFLLRNHLSPALIADIGSCMLRAPNAKEALAAVLGRLEMAGVDKWHPQLRASGSEKKG